MSTVLTETNENKLKKPSLSVRFTYPTSIWLRLSDLSVDSDGNPNADGYFFRWSTSKEKLLNDSSDEFYQEPDDEVVYDDDEFTGGTITICLPDDENVTAGQAVYDEENDLGYATYRLGDTFYNVADPDIYESPPFRIKKDVTTDTITGEVPPIGATEGETYYFQVCAVKQEGESETSEEIIRSDWSDIIEVKAVEPSDGVYVYAISASEIQIGYKVQLDEVTKLERRKYGAGESNWETVTLTGETDSIYWDEETLQVSGIEGNVLYEYRITWRFDSGIGFSFINTVVDTAFLTHTRPYIIDSCDFVSSGIYHKPGDPWYEPDAEYQYEILRPDVVAMEIPLPVNGKNGEYSRVKNTVYYAGQTPTFLARILNNEYELKDSDGNKVYIPVTRDEVEGLWYTVYKVGYSYGAKTSTVPGHTDVYVPFNNVPGQPDYSFWITERLVPNDPVWKSNIDDIGYNFKFTPTIPVEYVEADGEMKEKTVDIFPSSGTYEIRFSLKMKEGNPIVWRQSVTVL